MPTDCSLGPLGEGGRLEIGAISGDVAAGALAALPALRRGKSLLSVPSLWFSDGSRSFTASARSILAERLAEPQRFPDFAAD